MGDVMRLDRLLAFLGEGTRSEARELVRAGRVCVDGTPVRDAGMQVDAARSAVTLDGRTLCTAELVYETDVGVRAPRPSNAARLFAFFARLLRIQPED